MRCKKTITLGWGSVSIEKICKPFLLVDEDGRVIGCYATKEEAEEHREPGYEIVLRCEICPYRMK